MTMTATDGPILEAKDSWFAVDLTTPTASRFAANRALLLATCSACGESYHQVIHSRNIEIGVDCYQTSGGEPLLKLLAVDWLKSDQKIDHISLQPSCCVQSAAGMKAPFILVINLQVNCTLHSRLLAAKVITTRSSSITTLGIPVFISLFLVF